MSAGWSSTRIPCFHRRGLIVDFNIQLEYYFVAEEVLVNARVRVVMLHLEGRALDWHHFYAQRQAGFHMLEWESYAQSLKNRFGSQTF
ncbi:hypothetical protein PVK06_047982 [Gossypium arboreum]|uniref:Retrotransposon gag domain-containing protein n=1 Tax=Gossypium arboreum TaxID=29729 RepID=A0ABR0MGN6_GOSAR|nr:hypothetical protein PVK06_047982 [Gossypium arboreum]